jgi:hypothetical protein
MTTTVDEALSVMAQAILGPGAYTPDQADALQGKSFFGTANGDLVVWTQFLAKVAEIKGLKDDALQDRLTTVVSKTDVLAEDGQGCVIGRLREDIKDLLDVEALFLVSYLSVAWNIAARPDEIVPAPVVQQAAPTLPRRTAVAPLVTPGGQASSQPAAGAAPGVAPAAGPAGNAGQVAQVAPMPRITGVPVDVDSILAQAALWLPDPPADPEPVEAPRPRTRAQTRCAAPRPIAAPAVSEETHRRIEKLTGHEIRGIIAAAAAGIFLVIVGCTGSIGLIIWLIQQG